MLIFFFENQVVFELKKLHQGDSIEVFVKKKIVSFGRKREKKRRKIFKDSEDSESWKKN